MPARARQSTPAGTSYADRPWLASYPDGVPADFDFPKVPLTRLLDDAASSFPTRTALAFLGWTMTYRELKVAVDKFAAGLSALGVRQGDRVAVILPNCPQNVIAFYATLRLGAVVVQHNPLYTESELRHQLADCGATVAVCLDRVYASVEAVRRDTALQHVVVTSIADYLPASAKLKLRLPLAKAKKKRAEITAPVPKGSTARQFAALLKTSEPARQAPLDPEHDLALLQYTGGTTGRSKGAMLTHYNLVSNAYMNRLWDTGAVAGKEVALAVLPLFHAYGLTVAMNATVLLAGTLVLLPRFDLDQVFEAIDEWKPTMFPGVPPIYKALADSPKAHLHDLRSIRLCVSGAMKLPLEIQEQFERISGAALVEGYGMTETSPSTHCNPVSGTRKSGSIGVPLPGTRCKVVSQEDPTVEVPFGQAGELAVAGPQVFRGYWGREDLTDVFTDDGFLLTGDVAVMDDDGFFTIVDRKKELIIAGGFNVYPSEVEDVLFSLAGVADAAVVGLPDKFRGESVKAYVVPQPGVSLTAADVIEHCARELTAYKVPKVVEFRDSLPRTPVGKLLRRVLVDEERVKAEGEAQPKPASVPGGRPRPRGDAADESSAATVVLERPAARKASGVKAPARKAPARKAPAKAAGKAAVKAPAKAAVKAPAKVAVKAPARVTGKAPAKKRASTPKDTTASPAPAKRPATRKKPAPVAADPVVASGALEAATQKTQPAPVQRRPVAVKKVAARKSPASPKRSS